MNVTFTLITRIIGVLLVAGLGREIGSAILLDTRRIVFDPSKTLFLLVIVLFTVDT